MRSPEHSDYPHEPGRLHDCPACESRCHCDGEVAAGRATPCIWEGHEQGLPGARVSAAGHA